MSTSAPTVSKRDAPRRMEGEGARVEEGPTAQRGFGVKEEERENRASLDGWLMTSALSAPDMPRTSSLNFVSDNHADKKTEKRKTKTKTATSKAGFAEPAPAEGQENETSQLHIVHPAHPSNVAATPKVDIIAVHELGESLWGAWTSYTPMSKPDRDKLDSHDHRGSELSWTSSSNKEPYSAPPISIQHWLAGQEGPRESMSPSPSDAEDPELAAEPDDSLWLTELPSAIADENASSNISWAMTTWNREARGSQPAINGASSVSEIDVAGNSLSRFPFKKVNWLTDPDMLPAKIRGSRVMCYTYNPETSKPATAPWEYLTQLAIDLIRRLVQARSSETIDYRRVPMVFIGRGFGALIVQRAVMRLAIETRENLTATTGFLQVASLVLLDPPAAGPNRDRFPRSTSEELEKAWTLDWLRTSRFGGPPQKIDVSSMWSRLSRILSAYAIPVIWHHLPTPTNPSKNLEAMLVPRRSPESYCLSRFSGPDDIDYLTIVEAIQRSLVVLCSCTKLETLGSCLAGFLEDRFPVDLPDQLGQTPLHLAVKACNPDAVRRIIYQGKASVTQKDIKGRSPLIIAIQEAVQCMNEGGGFIQPEQKKAFSQIITVLIKNGTRVHDWDNKGNSPWALAQGQGCDWIRQLIEQHFVFGSSSATSPNPDPEPPRRNRASIAYEMTIAEVFLRNKPGRRSEIFSFEVPSVYNALYNPSLNLSKILARSRPKFLTNKLPSCRWIHVPANNEQWIHDVMISLDIDSETQKALGGQRHEGSRLIDRYMRPEARKCNIFRVGVDKKAPGMPKGPSSSVQKNHVRSEAVVIFMPVLGFERHRHRKHLARAFAHTLRAIRTASPPNGTPKNAREVFMFKEYLECSRPVHCRRTLDQFLYYMLDSTEVRDMSQVAYRWARDQINMIDPKDRPIIMVDQLWVWAFDDGTVVSSSPSTWDPRETFDLRNTLVKEVLDNKDRPILTSSEDLLGLILKTSIDFFRRKGPGDFQFHEGFRASINKVSEQQSSLYHTFRHTTMCLQDDTVSSAERKKHIKFLFSLEQETEILVEIMDIQDELRIVDQILTQQHAVLTKLLQLYPKVSDEEASHDDTPTRPRSSGKSSRPSILQNRHLLDETFHIVEDNQRVVADMLVSAQREESSLRLLIDLKQKHANGWEARFAREGSEESQRQGKIILVLTLVTVVFLPLSFMTSFFALEIDVFPKSPETQENLWPIADISRWVFGLSAAIFTPLIVLALSINTLMAGVKSLFSDPDKSTDPLHKDALFIHDSDPEDSSPNSSPNSLDGDSSYQRSDPPSARSSSDAASPKYAPLFGRWTFHAHIPYLRNLWRWRRYPLRFVFRVDNPWTGRLVRDYPLRRFRRRLRLWAWSRYLTLYSRYRKKTKRVQVEKIRRKERAMKTKKALAKERTRSSTSLGVSSGGESEGPTRAEGYFGAGKAWKVAGKKAGEKGFFTGSRNEKKRAKRAVDDDWDALNQLDRPAASENTTARRARSAWLELSRNLRRRKGEGPVDEEKGPKSTVEGQSVEERNEELRRQVESEG
ncbi:hypothetical protein VTJ83DRAFT_2359 [Remersonia thermophila]|uniref:Ankyrin repeat protein n=1 Tax=Remersonia thermophila TaxID=72144 RepID=A0ABR4DIK2_9PEZI